MPSDCQTPNAAPAGSAAMHMRPAPGTSIGSMIKLPPLSVMSLAVASVSSLAMYSVQNDGWPSGIVGPIARRGMPVDLRDVVVPELLAAVDERPAEHGASRTRRPSARRAPRGRPNTACPRARWCLGWACDAPLCLRRPSLPPTPDSLRPGIGERLSSGGCPASPSDASSAPKTPRRCSSRSRWRRSSTCSSTTSSPRRARCPGSARCASPASSPRSSPATRARSSTPTSSSSPTACCPPTCRRSPRSPPPASSRSATCRRCRARRCGAPPARSAPRRCTSTRWTARCRSG